MLRAGDDDDEWLDAPLTKEEILALEQDGPEIDLDDIGKVDGNRFPSTTPTQLPLLLTFWPFAEDINALLQKCTSQSDDFELCAYETDALTPAAPGYNPPRPGDAFAVGFVGTVQAWRAFKPMRDTGAEPMEVQPTRSIRIKDVYVFAFSDLLGGTRFVLARAADHIRRARLHLLATPAA